MSSEVEEIYHFESELPQYQVIPDAVHDFNKKHRRYPAKVILNPKYKDIGSKYFISFPTQHAPAIQPLGNQDIEASTVQSYNVVVQYDEEVGEKTLICRGFATL